MKIALVGNPNCGKTTLFNAYTGSSQYVGNWPGVTVEKKEGRYKKNKEVHIVDLPGVYSLSPYTLEEVITRDFLINENPDVIINIIDAVNLERNLYLTSQILDMGIPTVIALNRMDMVKSEEVTLDVKGLSKRLGVPVIPLVATKNKGIDELMDKALRAKNHNMDHTIYYDKDFLSLVEKIEKELKGDLQTNNFYHAVKIIEKDQDSLKKYHYDSYISEDLKKEIEDYYKKMDDDGESIVIGEKYNAIADILDGIYEKSSERKLSRSDKIDRIVTNKWLGLPIFFAIMWLIYYLAIETVGDWAIGLVESGTEWLQVAVGQSLDHLGASEPVVGLVADGIIAALGAIFTFVPQLMILFLGLSILEDSGYMARVAFIMDKLFRKFGLSGKSFIPMLIGTGCSIPGVMAARTIENENDRNMTVILTPFVPCGAKLPVFALFIGRIFSDAAWIGPTIYLIAFIVIILSGIILKKTKRFSGEPAPFVMELPPYTLPTFKGILIHMWERAKGFIIKAGSVIFLANVILWFFLHFSFSLSYVGEAIDKSMLATIGGVLRYIFVPLGFGDNWAVSVASINGLVAKEVVVTTFASIGSKVPIEFSKVTAFSFMIFTLFAAPCFAAIGAMKRELNDGKLTAFALSFQTGVAYILAMLTNVIGHIIFKGTDLVKKVDLDYTKIPSYEEADSIVSGPIYGYLALAVIVICLGIALYSRFFTKEGHEMH